MLSMKADNILYWFQKVGQKNYADKKVGQTGITIYSIKNYLIKSHKGGTEKVGHGNFVKVGQIKAS